MVTLGRHDRCDNCRQGRGQAASIVDASADLLTAVLEKLANVSHKKQVEKGLAIFEAARGVFAATANIHSIVLQDLSLCNPMANGTFHNSTMPYNVTVNYTASCLEYPPLVRKVDSFLRREVSITDFMASVADVVTALMKLDNAIVADP